MNELDYFGPAPPGKLFAIMDDSYQYKVHKCIDPVHIFLDVGMFCKCGKYFHKPHAERSFASMPLVDLRGPEERS